MGARSTHNRVKSDPMGRDYQEVVTKAKRLYRLEFYILDIGGWYTSAGMASSSAVAHFTNYAGVNARAKWVETKLN